MKRSPDAGGSSPWLVPGLYVLAGLVVLRAVNVATDSGDLPSWTSGLTLAIILIGLPLVLTGAFARNSAGFGTRRGSALRSAATGGIAIALLAGVATILRYSLVGSPAADAGQPAGAGAEAREDRRVSIAVLPFTSVLTDQESEAFRTGMHEDVLTQLSKIDGLRVISRTSVMRYDGIRKALSEIGDELGVATVLEGSVQRVGERVRVNVQLIDAATDEHVWAETYDQSLTARNIFGIQSDIARAIAAALRGTLAPDVSERIAQRPTESLEAYDLYSRGRYILLRASTSEEAREAAALFRRASEADPEYAPAYVGIAEVYLNLWDFGSLTAEEALPPAKAAAERALELDGSLAEAHAALAGALEIELRFDEAEREFRRALELSPGSAEVHSRYGWLLVRLERYGEAVREARRAVNLDPLSLGNRVGLAGRLFFTRDYDGAIDESIRILEIEPEAALGYYFLGAAYAMQGRYDEGIRALERSIELDPETPALVTALAWVHARAGQREEALAWLAKVDEEGPILKEFALVYGELGDLDRAFEYLDRAYEQDPASLAIMQADPAADALRRDPRYGQLMERIGFE